MAIEGRQGGKRLRSFADAGIALLVVTAAAALTLHSLAEHDLFWQLATGREIAAHGVPRTDPFSFAFPGLAWIELRWLFCLALWGIQSTLGWNALVLASVAVVAGTAALFLRVPGPLWARNLGAAAAIAAGCARFALRPEIVSFALLVALLAALERARQSPDRRTLWLLVALQVVWVNTHTLFVLGPAVVALSLAGEQLAAGLGAGRTREASRSHRRWLLTLLLALAAACLLNPYFLRGALFPLELLAEIRGESRMALAISEFQSPFAGELGFFQGVYLAVAAAAALSFAGRRRPGSGRWPRALTLAAFFYLSLVAQRNVTLFALVAGVVLAANLGEIAAAREPAPRRGALAARAATLLIALAAIAAAVSDLYFRQAFEVRRFGLGVAPLRFPFGALAFADEHGLDGAMLHDIGDGGTVLWWRGRGGAFVDGRLEVYGDERLSAALPLLESGIGLEEATRRWGLRSALVGTAHQQGLLGRLENSPEWAPVYFDAGHVLYLHVEPRNQPVIDARRIDWRRPTPAPSRPPAALPAWRPVLSRRGLDGREQLQLARLYLQVGALPAARAAIDRGRALEPGDRELDLYGRLIDRARAPSSANDTELARRLARIEIRRTAGWIAELQGATRTARDDYRLAAAHTAATPADFESWYRTATALGDAADARQAIRAQTERFPLRSVGWNNRGLLAQRAGDLAEAVTSFERSLAIEPRQPQVWNQLALAHLGAGRRDEAIAALERALVIRPDYAPARDTLARLAAEGAP